jgi:hypothetical protein
VGCVWCLGNVFTTSFCPVEMWLSACQMKAECRIFHKPKVARCNIYSSPVSIMSRDARSVYQLAKVFITWARFQCETRDFFFLLHRVQTDSGTHPASDPIGTKGLSDRCIKLVTHLHLVPRSRRVQLYCHLSIRLLGMVLNYLSTGKPLPLPNIFFVGWSSESVWDVWDL